MATITIREKTVTLHGELPKVGDIAPDFSLANDELKDMTLADFGDKKKILNIVPSLDTPVCASSVREFNERANRTEGVALINVSMDLPFASWRFCQSTGLKNVTPLSAFRSPNFAEDYGVVIPETGMRGLLARAVVIMDSSNRVIHTQLVDDISNEPNYDQAWAVLG